METANVAETTKSLGISLGTVSKVMVAYEKDSKTLGVQCERLKDWSLEQMKDINFSDESYF